jgi:excinuclease ABC subunit B
VLDADKEGFLRSERSLMQTCGRAARNLAGRVILYGNKMTDSMRRTIDETNRRRVLQELYNREHAITPATVKSRIKDVMGSIYEQDYVTVEIEAAEPGGEYGTLGELRREIAILDKQMREAARNLAFEEAARLRDRMKMLKERELVWG